jgi:hypothetical protein
MKRKALFVGVNEYDSIPSLKCCLQDASALNGEFLSLGFDTLFLDNPDESEFKKSFKVFIRDLGKGDSFVFYFAGHGFTRKASGEQVFALKDSCLEDIELNQGGIAFNYIESMTNSRHGEYNRAFIIDACRSNLQVAVRGADAATRDMMPAIESLNLGNASRRSEPSASCCVFRSCRTGECAQEIFTKRHGLFTLSIIDVLKSARASGMKVTLGSDLHKDVCRKMDEMRALYKLPYKQSAEFRIDGADEMVILAGCAGAVRVPDQAAPAAPRAAVETPDKHPAACNVGDDDLADGIMLPIKVVDDYKCMLGRCGMSDIVMKMNDLGEDVRVKGERTGWRITDATAFKKLVASVPLVSIDEMRAKRAADRHGEIVAWFRNHRIDREFDSGTRAILEMIHDSITNTSEED